MRDIADYIESEADAATAMRVIQNIRTHVRTLTRDGLRFRERPALGPGRRALLIDPYMAFYRVIDDTVFVQRILHGARNISAEVFEDFG